MTTETIKVEVETNEASTEDTPQEVVEVAEVTAQETAEVAVEIAVDAAEVAVETAEQQEDFETWSRTQIEELTTTLNMVAEVQVIQAEQLEKLLNSQQMTSTEIPSDSLSEPVEMTELTEAQMTEAEIEPPSEVQPEVVEEAPLQSAVRKLKSRIRLL